MGGRETALRQAQGRKTVGMGHREIQLAAGSGQPLQLSTRN